MGNHHPPAPPRENAASKATATQLCVAVSVSDLVSKMNDFSLFRYVEHLLTVLSSHHHQVCRSAVWCLTRPKSERGGYWFFTIILIMVNFLDRDV